MSKKYQDEYVINCKGDAVTGDEIAFVEAVFEGSYRSPKYVGERTIFGRIVKDSYGAEKQQHTFTILVDFVEGANKKDVIVGSKIRRKGRNLYGISTMRKAWVDESMRKVALAEKHARGGAARAERDHRKAGGFYG